MALHDPVGSERERVDGRDGAVALPGVADRRLERLGQSDQRGRDEGVPGALAGHQDRVAGGADALDGAVEVGRDLARGRRRGRGRWSLKRLALEDVAGHLDVSRAGAAVDGQREGVGQGALDIGGPGHAARRLRDRCEGALAEVDLVDAVEGLERGLARDGAGQRDERRAGGHRAGDARDRVERARAGGDERDAGAAGQAAVRLGGQSGVVLVLDGHVLDPAEVGQPVVEAQYMVAVQAEDDLDAVGLEDRDRGVAGRDLASGGGADHWYPLLRLDGWLAC